MIRELDTLSVSHPLVGTLPQFPPFPPHLLSAPNSSSFPPLSNRHSVHFAMYLVVEVVPP